MSDAAVGVFGIQQKMGAALAADALSHCGSKDRPCCPGDCCVKQSRCCLPKAWELRKNYLDRLMSLENVSRKTEVRYRAALFVKEVAELSATGGEGMAKDVWPSLLQNGKYLRENIDGMQILIDDAKKKVEAAAEALCAWIRNPRHLEHLEKWHWDEIVDEKTALDIYQVDYGTETALAEYDPESDEPYLRVSDHCLAVLTEKLHLSDAGGKLLEDLYDEGGLGGDTTPAFRKMWEFVKKMKLLKKTKWIPKTVALYVFNLSHQVLASFAKEFAKKGLDNVADIVNNDRIGPMLDFLGKRIYPDAPHLLKEELEDLAEKHGENIWVPALRDKGIGHYLEEFCAEEEKTVAKLQVEGKAAYYSAAIAMMSLAFSSYALVKKFRSGEVDKKSVLEMLRDTLELTREELKIAIGAEVKSLGTRGLTAADLGKSVGRYLGLVTGTINMVLNVWSAEKALDEGKRSQFWCSMLAAGVSGAGAVGTLLCPPLAAVMMVASIAVALLSFALADPPVINWLKRTPWGVEQEAKFPMEDVVLEYCERVILARGTILHPSGANVDWFQRQRGQDGKFRRSDDGTFTVLIRTADADQCLLRVEYTCGDQKTPSVPPERVVSDDTTVVTFPIPEVKAEYELDVTARLLLPKSKQEIAMHHLDTTIVP